VVFGAAKRRRHRGARQWPRTRNPFEAAPDDASRALLASALHTAAEASPDDTPEINAARVQSALDSLHDSYVDRRLRELRVQMAEAQRRGDDAMLMTLAQEKMRLDRERKR